MGGPLLQAIEAVRDAKATIDGPVASGIPFEYVAEHQTTMVLQLLKAVARINSRQC